jgi:hypothetical protein
MSTITWGKLSALGFLAVGFFGLFVGGLRADSFAYMLAGTGQSTNPFGTVDLNTGAFTLIGSLGGPASGTYAGLGVANGNLYTEQNGGLYSVNTSNATLTLIGGPIGNNIPVFGSTLSGLYGLAPEGPNAVTTLVSIDPQTGAATVIGAVGVIGNGQVAYAKLSTNSSILYLENNFSLYTVNTTTGAATLVGTDPNSIFDQALLFENGTLYGGDNAFNINAATVDTISTTTGQITIGPAIVGAASSFGALAPDPLSAPSSPATTPEPATIVLLGAGLGAIGLVRRYRR